MKKLIITALVLMIISLGLMAFTKNTHLSLCFGMFAMIFVFIAAAKHESKIDKLYKSDVLMCSEGVIRHVNLIK